jgi:hypothetical protein
MSRRRRNRRDKRAEAEEFLAEPEHDQADTTPEPAEITTTTGHRIDLRAPWKLPSERTAP